MTIENSTLRLKIVNFPASLFYEVGCNIFSLFEGLGKIEPYKILGSKGHLQNILHSFSNAGTMGIYAHKRACFYIASTSHLL